MALVVAAAPSLPPFSSSSSEEKKDSRNLNVFFRFVDGKVGIVFIHDRELSLRIWRRLSSPLIIVATFLLPSVRSQYG